MTKPSLRETQQTLREEIFNILTMNCDNAESIEWRKGVTEAILQAIRKAVPKKKENHSDWEDLEGDVHKHGCADCEESNIYNSCVDDFIKTLEV
jgi:hypothetical protein